MTDKGESVLNGFSIEEIEVLSADIVIDVNQIPLLTANAEIVLKRRITRTLDRLEADVETIFTLGFDCAEHCSAELCPLIPRIAEVKKAISKIMGEV